MRSADGSSGVTALFYRLAPGCDQVLAAASGETRVSETGELLVFKLRGSDVNRLLGRFISLDVYRVSVGCLSIKCSSHGLPFPDSLSSLPILAFSFSVHF